MTYFIPYVLGSFLTVTGITIDAPESTPWTWILAVVVAVIDFAMTLIDLPVKVFELFLAPSLSEIVVVAPFPNGSSSTSLATPEGAGAPAP